MTRYFIELSYKGTHYNGWQIQPNAPSIQQTIEEALSKLLRHNTNIVGAGRTDTGVHASKYIAHFDTESDKDCTQENFVYHFNAILPKDIAIHKIYRVDSELHARFSALEREYKYYISTTKNPFVIDTAYIFTMQLDLEKMQEAANLLLNVSDFTSFAKLHTDTKTNFCKVTKASFEKNGDIIVFTIKADRFLRNMVRAIVGTLLEVGRGKITISDFKKIIEAKDRCAAKSSASSNGLFLTDIKY